VEVKIFTSPVGSLIDINRFHHGERNGVYSPQAEYLADQESISFVTLTEK